MASGAAAVAGGASSLATILNGVQRTRASHAASLKLVDTLLDAGSAAAAAPGSSHPLLPQLLDAVDRFLLVDKKDPAVDRLRSFLVGVALRRGALLAGPLLGHLAAHRLDAKSKVVRLQAARLIDGVLTGMPDDCAEIDDAVFDALEAGLLARCRDAKPPVRASAARALQRLQPENDDPDGGAGHPITAALAWLVAHDASPEVRASALRSVALGPDTLALLVDHTRDAAPGVRAAAFLKLTELVDARLLTPAARTRLLRLGLSDGSPDVVKQATLMLARWLAAAGADRGEGPGGAIAESGAGVGTPAAPALGYSLGALLESLAVDAPADERAVEGALYALFAFAEGPQPRAPAAASAADAAAGVAPANTTMHVRVPAGNGGSREVAFDVAPPTLWAGARAAIAAYALPPLDVTLGDALYWRVRASWLAGHAALGFGGAGLASGVPPAAREEALDAALPSVGAWAALLASVLHGVGVDVGDATSTGGGHPPPSADPDSLGHLAPTPAALGRLRSFPSPQDDAAGVARQLLALGQLLDFSDESSRRAAIAVLAAALPHPALPADLVPLAAHTLAVAAGAGAPVEAAGRTAVPPPAPPPAGDADAAAAANATALATARRYRWYVDLLGRTIGAAASAAEACLQGGGSAGGAGAGAGGGNSLAALRARADDLRTQVEDAADAADGGDDGARGALDGLTAALAEAEAALADAEAAVAMGGDGGDDGDGGVMLAVEGGTTLSAGQLGAALAGRAVALAAVLTSGAPVPPAVHQSVALPAASAALREALSPAVARAADDAIAAAAALAGDGTSDGLLGDGNTLVDDHPLLAGVLLPALSRGRRAALLAAAGGDGGDDEDAAAAAEVDALVAAAATASAGYLLAQPREAAALRLAAAVVPSLVTLAAGGGSPATVTAAAVTAVCDIAAALGAGAVPVPGNNAGGLLGLLRAHIQPEALLAAAAPAAAAASSSSSALAASAPLVVQAAAAGGLLKLALSGQVPAQLPQPAAASAAAAPLPGWAAAASPEALAGAWPLAGAMASLHCLHVAAVWAAATGGAGVAVTGAEAAAAPRAADDAAGEDAEARSEAAALALSALLHTLVAGLQAVARLSHAHKAAVLAGAAAGLRWMLPLARTLRAAGPVAGLGPGGGGDEGEGVGAKRGGGGRGRKAAAPKGKAAPRRRGKSAGANEDDDEDGGGGDSSSDGGLFSDDDEDGGDGKAVAPAAGPRPPRAPAPLRSGSGAGSVVGGAGAGSRSVVSVGSSMSALAAGGGGGSAVGAGGRWVAQMLVFTSSLAAVEPLAAAAVAGGGGEDAVAAALGALCPPLAPVAGELPAKGAAASAAAYHAALAVGWLVEAAADAAVFGPLPSAGGSLLAVFVPALNSLPPPASPGVTALAAGLTNELLRGIVTGARSASGEKAVRKLAGPGKWELPLDGKAASAAVAAAGADGAAALAAGKAAVAARVDGLRAGAVACGAISAPPAAAAGGAVSRTRSSSSASGGAGGGASTRAAAGSAAVGPAAGRASAPSPSARSTGSRR